MSEGIEFPAAGISDGEVRLRFRSDSDVPALIEACRDPEVVRWTRVPADYDEAKAAAWAGQSVRMMAEGTGLPLVIADAESDLLIGSIGINAIDYEERRCEVGYFLAPHARGRFRTSLTRWATRSRCWPTAACGRASML